MRKNRLWLLAHQDDELFGLHLNSKIFVNHVVYLTDGVPVGVNYRPERRVNEALRAWKEIDTNAEIIFFGTHHNLRDGELAQQIDILHFRELVLICQNRGIEEIVALQLEGGHQDHDIVSILAETLSKRLKIDLITFPAYRTTSNKFPFYVVMSSSLNMTRESRHSLTSRKFLIIQAFKLMKYYKSQLTTWIGLGPFVIFKYFFGNLSFIKQNGTSIRPQDNPNKLLYENRKKQIAIDYHYYRKKIANW